MNAQDDDGFTPLHHACRRGYNKMAEILLSSGADPVKTDHDGKPPSYIAKLFNHHDIVKMLPKDEKGYDFQAHFSLVSAACLSTRDLTVPHPVSDSLLPSFPSHGFATRLKTIPSWQATASTSPKTKRERRKARRRRSSVPPVCALREKKTLYLSTYRLCRAIMIMGW